MVIRLSQLINPMTSVTTTADSTVSATTTPVGRSGT